MFRDTHAALLWLGFATLILFASGCATIFNEPESKLTVHAPYGTTVRVDSGKIVRLLWDDPDERNLAHFYLSRSKPHALTFDFYGQQFFKTVTPSVETQWVLLDFISPLFLGYVIDAKTGNWKGYGDQVVEISPVINAATLAHDRQIEVARNSELPSPLHGFGVQLQLGESYGMTQAVIGFGHYGLGAGFRILPWFAVVGTMEGNEYVDLTADDVGANLQGDAVVYGGNVRIYPIGGLFISTGFGKAHLTSPSVYLFSGTGTAQDSARLYNNGFSQWIWEAHASVGYSGKYGFVEVRYMHGLEAFHLTSTDAAHFRMFTLHFGLNYWF